MKLNNKFFNQLFSEKFISEYNHSNYIDKIDNKNFFHFDCSGFIYWCLINMGYKRALVELKSFLKQYDFIKINRFFCKDFTFIYQNKDVFKYWTFTDKPSKNCICVVVFPDGNGHCMFIDDVIKNDKNNMLLNVVDSTCYPHQYDTRSNTGIGVGEIEIIYKNNEYFYDSKNSLLPIRKAEIYFVIPIK